MDRRKKELLLDLGKTKSATTVTQQILNFFLCISLPWRVVYVTSGECANSLTMCTQEHAKFRWGSSVAGFVAVSVSRWDGDKMLELLFGKTVCRVQEAAQVSVVSTPSCWGNGKGASHVLLTCFRLPFCCDSSLLFAVGKVQCYLQMWPLHIEIIAQYSPHLVFLPKGINIPGCRLVFSISLTGMQV